MDVIAKCSRLVIVSFYLIGIPANSSGQIDSIANDIIAKHIKSVGGQQRIESVKSELKVFSIYKAIDSKNPFVPATDMVEEYILYFDTIKMFLQSQDQLGRKTQTTIMDGEYWLHKEGIKTIQFDKKYAVSTISDFACEPTCYLWKNYWNFKYEGIGLVNDKECFIIRGYHKYHAYLKESVFYFDSENYMLVKDVSVGFNRYFLYSDYREQSGIIFPFKEQKYENGKLDSEKLIQSITVNYFTASLDVFFKE